MTGTGHGFVSRTFLPPVPAACASSQASTSGAAQAESAQEGVVKLADSNIEYLVREKVTQWSCCPVGARPSVTSKGCRMLWRTLAIGPCGSRKHSTQGLVGTAGKGEVSRPARNR
jgi:hypothetical protein